LEWQARRIGLPRRNPTIPYPGAKGKLAPKLVSMMPRSGGLFIEPVAGRGNVFYSAAMHLDFDKWWLNDIQTAPFFRALKGMKRSFVVPERTKEEFIKYRELHQKGDVSAILLEPYLTFSGGGYKKAGFGGKRSANALNYGKTLSVCSSLLRKNKVKITQVDWEKINFDKLGADDFVFFDPPYLGADVRAYSNQFNHVKMVEVLKNAKFKWMLTEYEQPLYLNELGQPCERLQVQLACDGIGTKRRVECIWKNY
jgi:site-specific DNA-adenine methylase